MRHTRCSRRQQTAIALLDTSSYTCTSMVPNTLPPSASFWPWGGSGAS